MLRKLFLIVCIASAMAVSAQIKIGTVNVQEIYGLLPEMEQAKTDILAKSDEYQKELENMRLEMQKKYADYQDLNANPATSDIIKQRRVQELQELDQKIQRFVASVAASLSEYQEQLLKPIQDKVAGAIREVGREGGFTMVYGDLSLNPSLVQGSTVEPIYITDAAVDVTAQVKTKLGIITVIEGATEAAPEAEPAPAAAPAPALEKPVLKY